MCVMYFRNYDVYLFRACTVLELPRISEIQSETVREIKSSAIFRDDETISGYHIVPLWRRTKTDIFGKPFEF